MSQTLSIAAPAEPGAGYGPGTIPGSAPDRALFALLMAEAGRSSAGGIEAGSALASDVDASIPESEGSADPIDPPDAFDSGPDVEATASEIPVPERLRPSLNLDAIRPEAWGETASRRLAIPIAAKAPDEAPVAEDVPMGLRLEKGLEREARLTTGLDVADPGADAGTARTDRGSDPSAGVSATAKPARLSDLDLEGFGVKRIEVQVEPGHRNESGATPLKNDSIDRATPRPVDAAVGPRGEAIPIDAIPPRPDHFRTPESGLHVSEGEVLEEPILADDADSGAGESGGGGRTSDPEWNTVAAGRTARPGPADPDLPVEAGADIPEIPPDPARPTGDLRVESRESSALAGDRRALAPHPPKPPDPPTLTPEPARRVFMMVGDAENEVRVLVHESNGEVSVRFDAPHAIRAHLEASAHQLVESMSREQVSLTSMTFSGPFHGNDGHSNPRHLMRNGARGNTGSGSSGDTAATGSGLDFTESGTRIRIRV